MDKNHPENAAFHDSAQRLLTVLAKGRASGKDAREVYTEYRRLVKQPRLSIDLYIRLSRLFCETDHINEAEKITAFLLKKAPNHSETPAALLRLFRAFEAKKMADKALKCRHILSTKYPHSQEARISEMIWNKQVKR